MDSELDRLLLKVSTIMKGFEPYWFIAGGWAIDLYLGKTTRSHDDIEIAVFRRDQTALHEQFKGWRLQKVVNGEPSRWLEGEMLEPPVHELYCLNETARIQQLEILLNESNGSVWVYRRNAQVTKAIADCYLTSEMGVKFLCPEIVLLYKSKNPRARDEQDFRAVVQELDMERKLWLKGAIAACNAGHHWLSRL